MSSSVMVALTRMWRTIVAIMRGGNFCGAAWHRPQFARYLRSPSIRRFAESRSLGAASAATVETPGEVAGLGASAAVAPRAQTNAAIQTNSRILILIVPVLVA